LIIYLDENQKYPSGIEELLINFGVIPFITKTINSICSLTSLTKLNLSGYVSFNMSDIDKILTCCDKINELYVSCIDIDIEYTINPHKNVRKFELSQFNNDCTNNNKIDMYSFFPELEILIINNKHYDKTSY
jgi:hypothetical protein